MPSAVVLRYASIGDAIQAASPIAELKAQGFTVDVVTSEIGEIVLRHDPNINEIKVIEPLASEQDEDYKAWLTRLTGGYDRVCNLIYSTEGELATEPVNRNYYLPDEVRRSLYGTINYVERQHLLSQVRFRSNKQWFYQTDTEEAEVKAAIKDKVTLGIALCGSHGYKAWSDLSKFCLEMTHRPVRMVILGAFEPREIQLQERIYAAIKTGLGPNWETKVDIMTMLSSPLRTSLAMACHVDVLIGSDTGLLNAAAIRPNRKILLLTHNTPENVCRDWRNTYVVQATAACAPCLRLRHRPEDCPLVDGEPACTFGFNYSEILREADVAISRAAAFRSSRHAAPRGYRVRRL